MINAYIRYPYGGENKDMVHGICRTLEKKKIRCFYVNDMVDPEEALHALDSCDVYITFLVEMNRPVSLLYNTECMMAEQRGIPIVLIRCDPNELYYSPHPDWENCMEKGPYEIFDLTDEYKLKEMPEFIETFVQNHQNGEYSYEALEARKPDEAYEGDKPYIFISYSHKDRREVFQVIRQLQHKGFRVWYDEGIHPGTQWDDVIAARLNDCGYIIAFISKNYMQSENCKDEINFARDLNKERLLVYLEETKLSPGMSMRLSRLQAIYKYKYTISDDFYQKLFTAQGIEAALDET